VSPLSPWLGVPWGCYRDNAAAWWISVCTQPTRHVNQNGGPPKGKNPLHVTVFEAWTTRRVSGLLGYGTANFTSWLPRLCQSSFIVITGDATVRISAVIFWGTAPCSPYVKRRFGEKCHLSLGRILSSLLLHAGILLGWFSILKMEVILSSEASVHIRTTRRYIPEMVKLITTAVRPLDP
jgi:hypothetical protein